MKKKSSLLTARVTLGTLFFLSSLALLCAIPLLTTHAQNPSSGTVGPSPGGPSAGWDQTIITPGGNANTEATCVDGTTCEVFNLTVASGNWTGQKVMVRLNWQSNGNEYDIYIRKGANNVSGTPLTSAVQGPGLTSQTAFIDVAANGTGPYTVHIVPNTTPVVTDKYHGSAIAVPLASVPPQ